MRITDPIYRLRAFRIASQEVHQMRCLTKQGACMYSTGLSCSSLDPVPRKNAGCGTLSGKRGEEEVYCQHTNMNVSHVRSFSNVFRA